jgi:hypothetical protein
LSAIGPPVPAAPALLVEDAVCYSGGKGFGLALVRHPSSGSSKPY